MDHPEPTYPPHDDGRWDRPLLAGRVAVVTGGAGAIGGAVCALFANQGAEAVVVVDIDEERTAEVVAHVESRGVHARGIVCDLTDDQAADAMCATVLDELGRVDVLVNGLGHALAPASSFEATG